MLNEVGKLSENDKTLQVKLAKSLETSENFFQNGMPRDQKADFAILECIDHFFTQNQSLSEVISLKTKLNNNELKIRVVEALLNDATPKIPETKAYKKKRSESSTSSIDEEIEKLENEIDQNEQTISRLNVEFKNIKMKTSMIEKEITKNEEFLAAAEKEDVDRTLEQLENQIKEIKKELADLGQD